MTFVYFLVVLGILIFVHELGHFIVAKRQGVTVETFSMGFGPRLFGVRRGGTDYRISAILFGGYVKMLGEDPSDEKAANDPGAFTSKSAWARAKIIVMGSLANIALCLVLLPIVFMIGRDEPVYLSEPPVLVGVAFNSPAAKAGLLEGDLIVSAGGKKVSNWEEVLTPVMIGANSALEFVALRGGQKIAARVDIGELPELSGGYAGFEPMLFIGSEAKINVVKPESPAAAAGVKPGDKVISFAGNSVSGWFDLSERVNANGGKEATIVVLRDGKEISLGVTPAHDEKFNRWMIGISPVLKEGLPTVFKRLGFFDAVKKGVGETAKIAGIVFVILKKLVTLELSYKALSGPIIIAKYSAAAAAMGLADFLYFVAFVSIQLGILNLMPIPILDGGQLVFIGIEAIFRRPINVRVQTVITQVGFFVIAGFMLLVTFNDMDRVWGIGKMIKNAVHFFK